MEKTSRKCPFCGQETNIDSQFCPFCGKTLITRSSGRKYVITALIIAAVAFGGINAVKKSNFLPNAENSVMFVVIPDSLNNAISSVKEKLTPSKSKEPAIQPAKADFYPLHYGTYTVGKDFPAGSYMLLNTSDYDYNSFNVCTSFFNRNNIYSSSFSKNYFVTLNNKNMLYIDDDAKLIPFENIKEEDLPDGTDGMYLAGFNINAGEYVLFPKENEEYYNSYFTLYGSDGAALNNIIGGGDNSLSTDNYIVTINDNEYLFIDGYSIVPIDEAQLSTDKSGTFKVGKHIPAGEYAVIEENSDEGAYISIYKGGCCRDENMLDFTDFRNNYIVNLTDGMYISLCNAHLVPLNEANISVNISGMFKVGTNIDEGQYILTPTDDYDGGYYTYSFYRIIDPSEDYYNSFIDAGDVDEETYISVYNGQYLYIENCNIEKLTAN